MVRESRRRKAPVAQKTVRLNAALPHDVHTRLAVHALMTGRTQADIIAELVTTHLRNYRVQVVGKSSGPEGGADLAADAEMIGMQAA